MRKNSSKLKIFTGMSSVILIYLEGMLNLGGLVRCPQTSTLFDLELTWQLAR